MIWGWIGPVLALLLLLVAPAQSRGSAVDDCTARTAQPASVGAIASDPTRWMGRCVTVTAVADSFWLYENADGYYRRGSDLLDPTSNGLSLGMDDRRRGGGPVGGFPELTVVGRVQDCETMRNRVQNSAGPGEFVMVSGYCHYFNGAYLRVTERKTGPARPFERRLDASGGGNLVAAAPDWASLPLVEAQSSSFLAALRARDEAALVDLLTADPGEFDLKEARASVRELLAPSSPFRDLPPNPQRTILVERGEDGAPDGGDAGAYGAVVCYCRKADCGGRWPIATFDADNLPARPYVCLTVGAYLVHKQGVEPIIDVPDETYGLKEP